MTALSEKIIKIDKIYAHVSKLLDNLDFSNFDNIFPAVVKEMSEAVEIRQNLVAEFGQQNVIDFNPDLFLKAKQLEKKYDNIVERFRKEKTSIEKELSGLIQNRKLQHI